MMSLKTSGEASRIPEQEVLSEHDGSGLVFNHEKKSVLAEGEEGHTRLREHWSSKGANPIWHQDTGRKLVMKGVVMAEAHSR